MTSVTITESDLRDPKAFFERSWTERYGTMGDHAEAAFRHVQVNHGRRYERFGLDRPSFSLRHLPDFLLYTPDYITATHLVEVKGVGKDHTLKVKCKQLDILCQWDELYFPVSVFIWNSYRERWTEVPAVELWELCHSYAEHTHFPEGPPAWFFDLDRVVLEWRSIDT